MASRAARSSPDGRARRRPSTTGPAWPTIPTAIQGPIISPAGVSRRLARCPLKVCSSAIASGPPRRSPASPSSPDRNPQIPSSRPGPFVSFRTGYTVTGTEPPTPRASTLRARPRGPAWRERPILAARPGRSCHEGHDERQGGRLRHQSVLALGLVSNIGDESANIQRRTLLPERGLGARPGRRESRGEGNEPYHSHR